MLRIRTVRLCLPGVIVDTPEGKKWVGDGQVCAGGCCPCLNNKGDWTPFDGTSDGSAPDKPGKMHAMSPFWPPCLHSNTKPVFFIMQKVSGRQRRTSCCVMSEQPHSSYVSERRAVHPLKALV